MRKGNAHVIRHATRNPHSPSPHDMSVSRKIPNVRTWSKMILRWIPDPSKQTSINDQQNIWNHVTNYFRLTPEYSQVAPELPPDHEQSSKQCQRRSTKWPRDVRRHKTGKICQTNVNTTINDLNTMQTNPMFGPLLPTKIWKMLRAVFAITSDSLPPEKQPVSFGIDKNPPKEVIIKSKKTRARKWNQAVLLIILQHLSAAQINRSTWVGNLWISVNFP